MLSKCSACGSHLFELVEQEPRGSSMKVNFVQCSSCGVPVGTMDYFNIGSIVSRTEANIRSLLTKVEQISWDVNDLKRKVK